MKNNKNILEKTRGDEEKSKDEIERKVTIHDFWYMFRAHLSYIYIYIYML